REVLARAGVPAERVAVFLVHYLDARVAREAAEAAHLPGERVVVTAEAAGHIAAAGIPIALADALAAGRVGKGDLVCCVAFGAGMSWGAVLLRLWTEGRWARRSTPASWASATLPPSAWRPTETTPR